MSFFDQSSVLEEMFNLRSQTLTYNTIKEEKEYKEIVNNMEKNMKSLLRYVPKEEYHNVELEIENFMYDYIMQLGDFWNEHFYRYGFIDGFNLKREMKGE